MKLSGQICLYDLESKGTDHSRKSLLEFHLFPCQSHMKNCLVLLTGHHHEY